MDTYDSRPISGNNVAFAANNFRKILQRQIDASVNAQLDAFVVFKKGNADGRYGSSRPSPAIAMSNQFGFRYFIVGNSIIGTNLVAAP